MLNFLYTNVTLLELFDIEVTAFVREILALNTTLDNFSIFIIHAKIRYIRIEVGPFVSIFWSLCHDLLLLSLTNDN